MFFSVLLLTFLIFARNSCLQGFISSLTSWKKIVTRFPRTPYARKTVAVLDHRRVESEQIIPVKRQDVTGKSTTVLSIDVLWKRVLGIAQVDQLGANKYLSNVVIKSPSSLHLREIVKRLTDHIREHENQVFKADGSTISIVLSGCFK